ncbi:MAG: GNAT family N-acetyltransferase [Myxococcota bacterium]
MSIRAYRPDDAKAVAELAVACARGENDFVLNPLWETSEELDAEFRRFGIAPEEHLWVADPDGNGDLVGLVGFLRRPGDTSAGMICPIVRRGERGRGVGGELLRAAQNAATDSLGIDFVTAGIGTRNRGGYSLLSSHGFRPVRQAFLMRCDRAPESLPEASLQVEPATTEHAGPLCDLYNACDFEPRTPDQMRSVLEDGRHLHWMAWDGEQLIAFVELETHWPERPWVAFVGVDPERRGRGLGTQLVSHALANRFADGARAGLLMLSPANRSAMRAYEKTGFRRFRLIDVLEKRL